MVEEIGTRYRYYALLHAANINTYSVVISESKVGWSTITKDILDRLSKDLCGIEAVDEYLSFKGQGKKKISIKRDKIFIVASKDSKRKQKYQNRDINWDHSWKVRGHWKYMRCLACGPSNFNNGQGCPECDFTTKRKGFTGLDRNGNRTVDGKTWVHHYTKQEEKAVLCKKIRLVQT
jgi:hypothetical protein